MEDKMNNYIDTFLDDLSNDQILRYADLIFRAEAWSEHFQDGHLSDREGNIRKQRAVRKLVAYEKKLGLDPTYSADLYGLKVTNECDGLPTNSAMDLSLELSVKAINRYTAITKQRNPGG
jgi:hypothetical protein